MYFAIFLQFFIIVCSSINIYGLSSNAPVSEGNSVGNSTGSPTLEGRIVNGTKATLAQFPHQVSLRRSYSNRHFCGGNVISDEWILTAGHCMFVSGIQILPWTISVMAGQIKLNPKHPCSQQRAVQAIILHPEFDAKTLTNDIALLKLTTPLMLNTTYVKAAKLQKIMPEPKTVCEASGWGYLAEDKRYVSNDLMYVSLPIIDLPRCRELLANVTLLPPGMFCAGWEQGLRDSCQGDSGGGMMCGDVLSGIISSGEGCARPKLPGVYTDVAYYRDWINNEMKIFNQSSEFTTKWKTTSDQSGNSSLNVYSYFSLNFLLVTYTMLGYFGELLCHRL